MTQSNPPVVPGVVGPPTAGQDEQDDPTRPRDDGEPVGEADREADIERSRRGRHRKDDDET